WSLLFVPCCRFLFSRAAGAGALRPRALGFGLLWASWCVAFFSLSRGKLPLYLLPALPGLALVLGGYLGPVVFQAAWPALFQRARTRVPRFAVAVLAAAGFVLAFAARGKGLISLQTCLLQTALAGACLAGVVLWGRRLPARAGWGLCCVLMAAL